MDAKFLNLGRRGGYSDLQGQKDLKYVELNRATPRHIIIKLSRVKEAKKGF